MASVANASLRSGECGLPAQHLLAGLCYTHPPKPHSHPGHGTNVTGPRRLIPSGFLNPRSPAWGRML